MYFFGDRSYLLQIYNHTHTVYSTISVDKYRIDYIHEIFRKEKFEMHNAGFFCFTFVGPFQWLFGHTKQLIFPWKSIMRTQTIYTSSRQTKFQYD